MEEKETQVYVRKLTLDEPWHNITVGSNAGRKDREDEDFYFGNFTTVDLKAKQTMRWGVTLSYHEATRMTWGQDVIEIFSPGSIEIMVDDRKQTEALIEALRFAAGSLEQALKENPTMKEKPRDATDSSGESFPNWDVQSSDWQNLHDVEGLPQPDVPKAPVRTMHDCELSKRVKEGDWQGARVVDWRELHILTDWFYENGGLNKDDMRDLIFTLHVADHALTLGTDEDDDVKHELLEEAREEILSAEF